MRRYTWLGLLAVVALASMGRAGLHRKAWRTAYRYRLIDNALPARLKAAPAPHSPMTQVSEADEATELALWRPRKIA